MCGIAGSIGQLDRKVIESVRRAHDWHSYRGPDDEGSWRSASSQSDLGVQFFFRRLAIIDTSSDGHQPMVDAATGNEKWRFTTDAPVRVAPTLVGDVLYFGSDDGFAYAVRADDGALMCPQRFSGEEHALELEATQVETPVSQQNAEVEDR